MVVSNDKSVIVDVPKVIVQRPSAPTGNTADIVVLSAHNSSSLPALALKELLVIVTCADDVQPALLITHTNVLAPPVKPVIPVLYKVGVVMLAAPDKRVHSPVPTTGLLPSKVTKSSHTERLLPTNDVVGSSL